MRKIIFLLFLLFFVIGCTQEVREAPDEIIVEDEELDEANGNEEFTVPSSYESIKANLNTLIEENSEIGPDHYQELETSVDDLEDSGIDVTELRLKLEKLNVAIDPATNLVNEEETHQEETLIVEEQNVLPPCTGTEQFTAEPVDLDIVREISPLGSLNPPGHTIPTEHTYLHLGEHDSGEVFSLHSPGQIYVTAISEDDDDIAAGRREYYIEFSLCKDIGGYFNHVKELRGILKEEFDEVECEQWSHNPSNICYKNMFVKLEPGVEIGGVGHQQGNFDIGGLDYRKKLNFINPSQYGEDGGQTVYKVCPYDFYVPEIKDQFYSLLNSVSEPKCGEVMQDIPGTLHGNWFAVDMAWTSSGSWDKQLSFAHSNYDHSIPIISIGGYFTDAGVWEISPNDNGLINRRFEEVTADGKVYCYTGINPNLGIGDHALNTGEHSGKIIVQMVSDTQLQIEKQSGSCTGQERFTEQYVYYR